LLHSKKEKEKNQLNKMLKNIPISGTALYLWDSYNLKIKGVILLIK
jgi:hypothetical protein